MALYLYTTIINPPAYGAGDNNSDLVLALGTTTIVNMTSTQTLTFTGIAAVGGNVDGMVVTLSNITFSSAFTHNFAHETGGTAANRFRNAGLTNVNGGVSIGSVTYRYNGALLRWVEIARTT